jgi:hypothetical protein
VVFYGQKDGETCEFDVFMDRLTLWKAPSQFQRRTPLPKATFTCSSELFGSDQARVIWWSIARKAWESWVLEDEQWLRGLTGMEQLPDWCLPLYAPCGGMFPPLPTTTTTCQESDFWGGCSLTYWLAATPSFSYFSRTWLRTSLANALNAANMTESDLKTLSRSAAQVVANALGVVGSSRPKVDDATYTLDPIQVKNAYEFQPTEGHFGDTFGLPGSSRQNARAAYLAAISLLQIREETDPLLCLAKQVMEKMGLPMIVQGETLGGGEVVYGLWFIPESVFLKSVHLLPSTQDRPHFECICQCTDEQDPVFYQGGSPTTMTDVRVYRGFTDVLRRVYHLPTRPIQVVFSSSKQLGVQSSMACTPGSLAQLELNVRLPLLEPDGTEEDMHLSFERPAMTISPQLGVRRIAHPVDSIDAE